MNNKRYSSAQVLAAFLISVVFALAPAVCLGQDETEGQPVLEKGVPTLKFRTEDGWTVKVQGITFEGAPAISAPVTRLVGRKVHHGSLILTKDVIAYQPASAEDSVDQFRVARSEVLKMTYKSYDGIWGGRFKANSVREGKEQVWGGWGSRSGEENYLDAKSPAVVFLMGAYNDFDGALQQFQQMTAGLSPSVSPATTRAAAGGDAVKQGLWERFVNNRKTNPDVAYQAAKAYLQLYPDDPGENADLMRKWTAAYDKVKAATP